MSINMTTIAGKCFIVPFKTSSLRNSKNMKSAWSLYIRIIKHLMHFCHFKIKILSVICCFVVWLTKSVFLKTIGGFIFEVIMVSLSYWPHMPNNLASNYLLGNFLRPGFWITQVKIFDNGQNILHPWTLDNSVLSFNKLMIMSPTERESLHISLIILKLIVVCVIIRWRCGNHKEPIERWCDYRKINGRNVNRR